MKAGAKSHAQWAASAAHRNMPCPGNLALATGVTPAPESWYAAYGTACHTLVEICLTSNEVILGISGDEHPFEMYRRAGVPLSLGTDDEGISRSPLTMEFVKAVERYNLDYDDVKELVRNNQLERSQERD